MGPWILPHDLIGHTTGPGCHSYVGMGTGGPLSGLTSMVWCKDLSYLSRNSRRIFKRSISLRDTMMRVSVFSSVPAPWTWWEGQRLRPGHKVTPSTVVLGPVSPAHPYRDTS